MSTTHKQPKQKKSRKVAGFQLADFNAIAAATETEAKLHANTRTMHKLADNVDANDIANAALLDIARGAPYRIKVAKLTAKGEIIRYSELRYPDDRTRVAAIKEIKDRCEPKIQRNISYTARAELSDFKPALFDVSVAPVAPDAPGTPDAPALPVDPAIPTAPAIQTTPIAVNVT